MQQHGSKQFARRPPYPHPGDGVSRLKFPFLEHGHVAYQTINNQECNNMAECHVSYQIKGNHESSKLVANILPADRPHL